MGRAGKNKMRRHEQPAAGRQAGWLFCHRRAIAISLFIALFFGGLSLIGYLANRERPTAQPASPVARKVCSLEELLAKKPEDLAGIDIAEMNLLCAIGLPGAEDMDIDKCLARLDRWAARVKHETERHLYRLTDPKYKDHAEHYKHSEARFRAEWLMSVLQQDIGLHYFAGFVSQDKAVPLPKTSKEMFIHGLAENDDARKAFGGNCVSLPVAYAAVGRRLGYPIKLVCSREHTFCRWEGKDHSNPAWRDRFNFDGAGNGFSIDPDEFYLSWPRKTTPEQADIFEYLKSMTPAQELALFMMNRGHIRRYVSRDYPASQIAYAHAVRLWPTSRKTVLALTEVLDECWKTHMTAHLSTYQKLRPPDLPTTQHDGRFADVSPRPQPVRDLIAEIEMINEINRRNMERLMMPQAPSLGVPRRLGMPYAPQPGQPGIPNQHVPYRPPMPGQPPR